METGSEFKGLREMKLANGLSMAVPREALVQLENRMVIPNLAVPELTLAFAFTTTTSGQPAVEVSGRQAGPS